MVFFFSHSVKIFHAMFGLVTYEDFKQKIEEMEKRYDENFQIVFEAIKQMFDDEESPKPRIGYIKEKAKAYGRRKTKK